MRTFENISKGHSELTEVDFQDYSWRKFYCSTGLQKKNVSKESCYPWVADFFGIFVRFNKRHSKDIFDRRSELSGFD